MWGIHTLEYMVVSKGEGTGTKSPTWMHGAYQTSSTACAQCSQYLFKIFLQVATFVMSCTTAF
jgi:hypothetical protein